jgi:hypothetical protein
MTTPVIFSDPTGEAYGMPTYRWGDAPKSLATRRQLAAQGRRKNGHDPVAQMLRPRGGGRPPLVAYLSDLSLSAPRRPWTPAMEAAVQKAADSRKFCRSCNTRLDYVPKDYTCWPCHDANPTTQPQECAA